jgi:hypothetical protein
VHLYTSLQKSYSDVKSNEMIKVADVSDEIYVVFIMSKSKQGYLLPSLDLGIYLAGFGRFAWSISG